jgi:hypothetical protein
MPGWFCGSSEPCKSPASFAPRRCILHVRCEHASLLESATLLRYELVFPQPREVRTEQCHAYPARSVRVCRSFAYVAIFSLVPVVTVLGCGRVAARVAHLRNAAWRAVLFA